MVWAANTEVFNNLVLPRRVLCWVSLWQALADVRADVMFCQWSAAGIGLQFKYVVLPEAVLLCCAVLYKTLRDDERPGRTLSWQFWPGRRPVPTALVTSISCRRAYCRNISMPIWRANVAYLDLL